MLLEKQKSKNLSKDEKGKIKEKDIKERLDQTERYHLNTKFLKLFIFISF